MQDLEKQIMETLKHHLRYILDNENIISFNYNDLEDLKDDLMYSISLFNNNNRQ